MDAPRAAASLPPSLAPSLAVRFCGLELASPIILLSGCVGFGEEYTRVEGFSNRDAGAIVLKGTTGQPRLGNAPHRVYETPSGMLNAIGLQNPGVDYVVRRILPMLDFNETRFIANVCGSTIEEYVEVTRRFDDSRIDAIEINISCPNIKQGGVQFGNVPEMSARVVEACRRVTGKPLITKLSPNQADIRENARGCIEAGTDAFAVINTVTGMALDLASRRPVLGNGQGGIASVQDALEFIIAGASTIGLGTALFYDPLLCKTVSSGLAQYLGSQGLNSISELVGTLDMGVHATGAAC